MIFKSKKAIVLLLTVGLSLGILPAVVLATEHYQSSAAANDNLPVLTNGDYRAPDTEDFAPKAETYDEDAAGALAPDNGTPVKPAVKDGKPPVSEFGKSSGETAATEDDYPGVLISEDGNPGVLISEDGYPGVLISEDGDSAVLVPEDEHAALFDVIQYSVVDWAAGDYPVMIRESGGYFASLEEAVDEANSMDAATIEILGDINLSRSIYIESDITIVGSAGSPTVTATLGRNIYVKHGNLTLGGGTDEDHFTISSEYTTVNVQDGTIDVRDGVTLTNNNNVSTSYLSSAVALNDPNASGSISGGNLIGGIALWVGRGATLSEISGGVISGRESAVFLTDMGSRIDRISGGVFQKTTEIERVGFYVTNGARIGEISGGHFNTVYKIAFTIWSGGWVEEISGGEFISQRASANGEGAFSIFADGKGPTGIGTLSGGHYKGPSVGMWLMNKDSNIDYITGGLFEGKRGLSTENNCKIKEISGGKFTGSQYGILNVGTIGLITGNAEITGGSIGLWNYQNSFIGEIGGGRIASSGVSSSGTGVTNHGTINKISGGAIIGDHSAIYSSAAYKSKLDEITGGVFRGKSSSAIFLQNPVLLEPGLEAKKGSARFHAANKRIFNDESLVIYPDDYRISTDDEAEPVNDVDGYLFKYLISTNYHDVTYTVTGIEPGLASAMPGTESYKTGDTVMVEPALTTASLVKDGLLGIWEFNGWGTDDAAIVDGGFTMPKNNVNFTGGWTFTPYTYSITYDVNGGDEGSGPAWETGLLPERNHPLNSSVIPTHADIDGNHVKFKGWTTVWDDRIYKDGEDAPAVITDVDVTDTDITVYAEWGYEHGGDVNEPDGSANRPDGSGVSEPDGGANRPGGGASEPDGGANKPGGGASEPDEGTHKPDPSPQPTSAPTSSAASKRSPSPTTVPTSTPSPTPSSLPESTPVADGSGNIRRNGNSNRNAYPATGMAVASAKFRNEDAPIAGFVSDHIKYIYGYPSGGVNPDYPITRAETAAIIYRLLEASKIADRQPNPFTDVSDGEWYAEPVTYLASIDIIKGYPDGTFKPDKPITRAEFATMISGFDNLVPADGNKFDDVVGHWAADFINSAAEKGWVTGYPEGDFMPENEIIRSEVVTVINRMLNRRIELEDIPFWAPAYNDLTPEHWAHTAIIEASIGHRYIRKPNDFEIWTRNFEWQDEEGFSVN